MDNSNDFYLLDLAKSPTTSPVTLDSLSDEEYEYIDKRNPKVLPLKIIRHTVAKNKNTSTITLESLSYDLDERIRAEVAGNPNVTKEIVERFLADTELVRLNVAKNSNTDSYCLDCLCEDQSVVIRCIVAERTNLSKIAQYRLSYDNDINVLRTLAKNINIEPEILRRLFLCCWDYQLCRHIAENPKTNWEILEKLSNQGYAKEVAANPNTVLGTLHNLGKSSDWWVRYAVKQNPNTPEYIKEAMDMENFDGRNTCLL
jgi:hypothetical protein